VVEKATRQAEVMGLNPMATECAKNAAICDFGWLGGWLTDGGPPPIKKIILLYFFYFLFDIMISKKNEPPLRIVFVETASPPPL